MPNIYRGQVIEVYAPAGYDKDGNAKLKPRPVVVLHNVAKNSDIVSVYCTTQNNLDDANNIFVAANSKEGEEMGITKDTYIRPGKVMHIPIESFKRLLGKCPFMQRITQLIEKHNIGDV